MRRTCLVLLALLSACSSSPADAIDAGGDAAAAKDGAVPAADAGSDAKDAASVPECAGPVTEASLCLGSASGHPGDRVMLPVYIVLPEGCASTTQVSTKIVPAAPIGTFVEQPFSKPTCWSLTDDQGTGTLWFATASAVGAGCPESLPPGELVTIELDIAAGAAAGTHELVLEGASVGDNLGACKGNGAISGQLTVLP
jgi:hypothetical protein